MEQEMEKHEISSRTLAGIFGFCVLFSAWVIAC